MIDANKVARESGMGGRINTVMQTCFFAISGVLPPEEAIDAIKNSIRKTYAKKARNRPDEPPRGGSNPRAPVRSRGSGGGHAGCLRDGSSNTRLNLCATSSARSWPARRSVPVSALPNDGTFPTGTTQFEKRNLASEVPVWDPEVCIQCGKCVMVCPHAVIRSKVYEAGGLAGAPAYLQIALRGCPNGKD